MAADERVPSDVEARAGLAAPPETPATSSEKTAASVASDKEKPLEGKKKKERGLTAGDSGEYTVSCIECSNGGVLLRCGPCEDFGFAAAPPSSLSGFLPPSLGRSAGTQSFGSSRLVWSAALRAIALQNHLLSGDSVPHGAIAGPSVMMHHCVRCLHAGA